jgi:uncharacterized membrane protein YkgB
MLSKIDLKLIALCRKMFVPFARVALFVVFFWFGFLKVIGESPASGVVQNLFERTIPIMEFSSFFILFGLFECLIGILFLIPKVERVVIPMLLVHMATTAGPLFLLTSETWNGFLIPTLEGQYIIKNLVIIATAIGVASNLKPIK